MKIIDFELYGNVIRFYLGADDCNDYWGDDWDDAPYEHNAGTVYDEYVIATADVALSADYAVSEPATGEINSRFCKKDFKRRISPCLIVFKPDDVSWRDTAFADNVGRDDAMRIYYGDDFTITLAALTDRFGALFFGITPREVADENR